MDKKEYIERGALVESLKKQYGEELGWQCTVNMSDVGMMIEDATAADVVSRGVYDQVKWERDMAMQQLEEHGIPFGGVADDVVKVRHGEWKKRGNEKKCSVCDFIYYSNADEWSWCPNCGARMDGERKDKENG